MGALLQGKAGVLALIVALVGGGVVLVSAMLLRPSEPGPAEAPPPQVIVAPDAGAPEPTAEDAADLPPPPTTAPGLPALAPSLPAIDVVRVADDGAALVAGSAAPGGAVLLALDGTALAEGTADAAGQFVLLLDLPPSAVPQVLTLEVMQADGSVLASPDEVVLLPRAAPSAGVAAADDAEPETETEPAATREQAAAPSVAVADDTAQTADTALAQTMPLQSQPSDTAETAAPAAPEPEPEADPVPALTAAEADTPALPPIAQAESGLPPPPAALEAGAAVASDDTATRPESAITAEASAVPPAEPASSTPQAVVLRADGGVALSGRAPQIMANVMIDLISYSETGAVQISGRAASGTDNADLRLYLDNEPVGMARAANGDWRLDLPDVAPGVYLLRVDQLDASGGVVSRFETPFQREEPALVAQSQDSAAIQTAGGAAGNAAPSVALITVQPGHSLWRISRERYGDGLRYVQIFEANQDQIRDPDLIYPGQIFVLPD